MADVPYVVGDTAPSLFGALADSVGAPFDLTGTTVRFQMRLAIDRRFTVDAVAVIVTPATGAVRYDWADGDLDEPGDYVSRWLVINADTSEEHTYPANTITVVPA